MVDGKLIGKGAQETLDDGNLLYVFFFLSSDYTGIYNCHNS